MSPGIRVDSLRSALQDNTAATLQAVAGIGQRRVELAGTDWHSARAFRGLLDAAGLVAPSGHVDLMAVTASIDRTVEDAHLLGHRYIIVLWLDAPKRTVDGYAWVAEALNRSGEQLGGTGPRLATTTTPSNSIRCQTGAAVTTCCWPPPTHGK
jgi:hypothetical protein